MNNETKEALEQISKQLDMIYAQNARAAEVAKARHEEIDLAFEETTKFVANLAKEIAARFDTLEAPLQAEKIRVEDAFNASDAAPKTITAWGAILTVEEAK